LEKCPIFEGGKRDAVFRQRRADFVGQRAPGVLHQPHKTARRLAVGPEAEQAREQREEKMDMGEEGIGVGHGLEGGAARKPAGLIDAQFRARLGALGACRRAGADWRSDCPSPHTLVQTCTEADPTQCAARPHAIEMIALNMLSAFARSAIGMEK
jgi:hypothetical protein